MKRIVTIEDGYARDTQVYTGDPNTLETICDWRNDYIDMKYTSLFIGIYEGDCENEIKCKVAERVGVHPDILTLTDYEPELGMHLLLSRDNFKIDWEFINEADEIKVLLEVWFDAEKKFGITMMREDTIVVHAYLSRNDARLTYEVNRADGTTVDEKVYELLTDAEKSLIREMANRGKS